MRILRAVGEEEVVAVFLQAELASDRWGDRIRELLARDGAPVSVVAAPDTSDAAANEYRRRLLDEHRGWVRRVGLFDGFPPDVAWDARCSLSGRGSVHALHQLGLVAPRLGRHAAP